MGEEGGSARWPSLKGGGRTIVSLRNIRTVSKTPLGETSDTQAEVHTDFS